jgi:hypothetical protein
LFCSGCDRACAKSIWNPSGYTQSGTIRCCGRRSGNCWLFPGRNCNRQLAWNGSPTVKQEGCEKCHAWAGLTASQIFGGAHAKCARSLFHNVLHGHLKNPLRRNLRGLR